MMEKEKYNNLINDIGSSNKYKIQELIAFFTKIKLKFKNTHDEDVNKNKKHVNEIINLLSYIKNNINK